jgi:hypothetical protein
MGETSMFIKKEYVNEVLAKAEKNLQQSGINLNPKLMERFKTELSDIASSSSYKEGDKIDATQFFKISNEAGLIINSIRDDLINSKRRLSQDQLKSYEPMDSLMTVTDYLYAMTMQALGCPSIPASFGSTTQKNVGDLSTAINCNLKLDMGASYTYLVYDHQRGKDAEQVWETVSALTQNANQNTASPREIETLAAEYQALQRRQNDHGFVWRLFHRRENAERTHLLGEMESALKNVLGQNVNLMKNSPLSLAESMFKKSAIENAKAAFSDDAMSKRIGVSLEAFGGENIMQNSDDMQKELTESLSKDLNVNEKKEIQQPKTEEINAPQKENVI